MSEQQLLFDKTRYMDRLRRDAGVTEVAARAYADAMEEALRESVATKSDIVGVKHEIQLAVRDVTIRIGGMLVVATGILIAIKFFP
jgi:hypothetical protein